MIFMIDNYDSFTFNLVQYFQELGQKVRVFRNDAITVEKIARMRPDCLVISPGPGMPQNAGISIDAIRYFTGRIPILGVCLGHQSIGASFGATIGHAQKLMHGKVSQVRHDGKKIFKGLENPVTATRYHSLAILRNTLPDCFQITATSEEKEIMGIRHKKHAVEGVQFHPESILTTCGKQMLANFLAGYHIT